MGGRIGEEVRTKPHKNNIINKPYLCTLQNSGTLRRAVIWPNRQPNTSMVVVVGDPKECEKV